MGDWGYQPGFSSCLRQARLSYYVRIRSIFSYNAIFPWNFDCIARVALGCQVQMTTLASDEAAWYARCPNAANRGGVFILGYKISSGHNKPHCLNTLFILLWLTLVYNAMIIRCLKYSYYESTFNIQGWIQYHVYIRFSPLEPTIIQYSTFMNFMKLSNNDLKIIDTFHISILHYIRKKYTVPSAEWKTTVSPSVIPRQLTF